MIRTFSIDSEKGFSLTELTVAILVFIPIMGAAIGLFSLGADQHATGQRALDANQDARGALGIMTTEISQAGSHPDAATTVSSAIVNSITAQSVQVASTAGFTVGDYVDVDFAPNDEIVQITAVTGDTLTGVFRFDHAAGVPIRLSALPYTAGIIPPADLGANSSRTVTTLRFFGHIQGANGDAGEYDPTIQYVEYNYDSTNNQITRSITPITQTTKNPALPFIRNVKPNSVGFTLNTDVLGVVTSARVAMTVQSRLRDGAQYQETPLSSMVSIPSAIAGSALLWDYQQYRGLYPLPETPSIVQTWAAQ